MKKTIIVAIIIALIPVTTFAITIGYGSDRNCIVLKPGMPNPLVGGVCDRDNEQSARLVELETVVDQLQKQNSALQQLVNQLDTRTLSAGQSVQSQDNTKIDALEKRVSTLEKAYNFIQQNVMQAIQTTIGLLQKLITK